MSDFQPIPSSPRFNDLRGQRFGQLVVTRFGGIEKGATFWWCRCDCGADKRIRAASLRAKSDPTISCGCSAARRIATRNRSHGLTRHPAYGVWAAMVQRCTNPRAKSYHRYGGRGIRVCDRWLSVENFVADMGAPPFAGAEIDRFPNRDGDYEPGNVRWASRRENVLNRDATIVLEHEGRRLPLSEWAAILGVPADRIGHRLRHGWSVSDALTAQKYARRQRRKDEPYGGSPLRAEQVREIRARVAAGESKSAVARAFGVTNTCVHCVVSRRTWRHVT